MVNLIIQFRGNPDITVTNFIQLVSSQLAKIIRPLVLENLMIYDISYSNKYSWKYKHINIVT